MADPTTLATGSASPPTATAGRVAKAPRPRRRIKFTTGFVVKLIALVLMNALVLWGITRMLDHNKPGWAIIAAAALLILDVIYVPERRFIPAKYLYPGTVFLLLFAVYPVIYTVYISFTNYGTGNNLTRNQAIAQIEGNSVVPPSPDSPRYRLQIMANGNDLGFFLTAPDGSEHFGTADGLQPVDAGKVVREGDAIRSYGDFTALNLRQSQDRKAEIEKFSIPTEQGSIKNIGFREAAEGVQALRYDPATKTMVNTQNGTVYHERAGAFVSDAGQRLDPGWRAYIGLENYQEIGRQGAFRDAFVRTFVWTFIFALLSVITTFVLGLLLAMVFHNPRMKGKRGYRSLLIIPYALPSFMTALVWKGMMNTQFGIINQFFGWHIPWLDGTQGLDRIWPYLSILLVNLWLGFPYMFLVCTGALQSIPQDLIEAAYVDGATGFKAFRRVTFPLLLVAVAPLLIASFAFNFNNFNLIYLLTEGKPPIPGSDIGRTDILISAAWKIAFGGGRGADYGLAAAISVVIFVIVATISAISFRYTKALEEVR
jgi:arabinogalactan oligomer / maltooligosaccharide transport system permease protein